MKKKLLGPSLESVFVLGVIAMLVLPPVVMAQGQHKELKVTIVNGDTTINGKNIKELSASDRKEALKAVDELGSITVDGKNGRRTFYLRKSTDGPDMLVERDDSNSSPRPMAHFRFKLDSTTRGFEMRPDDLHAPGNGPKSFSYSFSGPNGSESRNFSFDRREPMGPNHRNSQSFSYSSTNNDGISTRVNYNVSDANRETTKKITGAEKAELAIGDLVITPSFSTGKTNLSFTLSEKGNAEVFFKNSEGKLLWGDKTSGSFNKSFELPLNGIYYLEVKQNGKTGLRRILKEE